MDESPVRLVKKDKEKDGEVVKRDVSLELHDTSQQLQDIIIKLLGITKLDNSVLIYPKVGPKQHLDIFTDEQGRPAMQAKDEKTGVHASPILLNEWANQWEKSSKEIFSTPSVRFKNVDDVRKQFGDCYLLPLSADSIKLIMEAKMKENGASEDELQRIKLDLINQIYQKKVIDFDFITFENGQYRFFIDFIDEERIIIHKLSKVDTEWEVKSENFFKMLKFGKDLASSTGLAIPPSQPDLPP